MSHVSRPITHFGDDHLGVLLFNAAQNVEELRLRRRYGEMLVLGHGKNYGWGRDSCQRARPMETFLSAGAFFLKGFLRPSDARPLQSTLH